MQFSIRRIFDCRKQLAAIIMLALLSGLAATASSAEAVKQSTLADKNLLILIQGGKGGQPFSDVYVDALTDELISSGVEAQNIHSEYLDTLR